MTYRQLKIKEQTEQATSISADSDVTAEQVAALIRQSSTKQVESNLESANLQLTGAQQYAISQGLDADKIVIAWEGDGKRGVSGTLRIDQREKLQQVVAGIEAGKIKILWAYSVSRLFRDKFGVQSSTFVQICAKHHVKVVIQNAMTFDFGNETIGQMHGFIFNLLAGMAAKENEDRSKLAHAAKRQKAMRGEYDGRPLTPGFIVDRDKKSATFGKYIPYPPHLEVVQRLLARYRELLGQFNLLAREVEQMNVVFPPFADWVDKLDRSKFQFIEVCSVHGPNRQTRVKGADGKWHFERVGCELKGPNCTLLGYHILPESLAHLLQAVELVGYWKVDGVVLTDENGKPAKNHESTINRDTWDYCFSRMSPTLLDGSPNPNRIDPRATWQASTVKGKERKQTALLEGILTSPLGTVHFSDGLYYVSEKCSETTNRRRNILYLFHAFVDAAILNRLAERFDDVDYGPMLRKALSDARTNNAGSLVSVKEQIERYQATIANRKALLGAMGTAIDKELALQYNQDIIDAKANIDALNAKQNAAKATEDGICELCATIEQWRQKRDRTTAGVRRFLNLATDSISINEYSGHFITLTVVWSAPFSQVDVCYIYREDGGKTTWEEADEFDLAMLYPLVDRQALLERFPEKSWTCLTSYANGKGYERFTRANSSKIPDRTLSLKDWELFQRYGWKTEAGYHWLYDVSSGSNDLSVLATT